MNTHPTFFGIACRVAAFSFLMAGTASLIEAQQSSSANFTPKAPLLLASASTPLNLTSPDLTSSSSSSSSSSFTYDAASDATPAYAKLDPDSLSALDSSQPPPRRTYGRPHYSGGQSKWTGMGGFGFNLPTGGTHNYASTGWRFQVGFGPKLSENTAVLFQFDYDHFGIQTHTLNQQLALYQGLCPSCGFTQLNGNLHDWSFTLNPTFTLPTQGSAGAYAVVGAGFYHKYTQFTVPSSGTCFDPYFGYYQCTANQPLDWYTSNAFGVNGGIGFTWKVSKFSNEKFYAEARYVYTANSRRRYDVSGSTSYFNAFTQASAPTTYIPITFGLRF